tara:strand:- start:92 stop:1975 length:1884 start_codon:yes stop_codon:yes gene_type:complete
MALEFTPEFEQSLSQQQGVRSDKIANTPLKDLIGGSTRKDKKTFISVLSKGDLLNNTLREINENSEIKEKFGRFFEQQGKNKKTSATADRVLGAFQPFFEEAGYIGPKGNNPARVLLAGVIGTKAIKELFPTDPVRKVPSPYPFDTYVKLKEVVTGLLNSKDKAERLAGTQLAMHVIGGYRPSDFKNLRVENIDFTSGVVSDLEIKDRGATSKKQGYFPKIIRDILLKEVDPEGQGLVFPKNNEAVINNALKKANISTQYTTAGKVKQGVFTLEDTRKLNETHLTTLGYDEKDPTRLAATLRANKTTIGQYVATGAGGRSIEELFVKTSSPHVAFTGTSNHAQYLSDIGVKPSDIVKRYKVTNKVIDRFPLDRVAEFQEKYPTLGFLGGDEVITSTLSEVNEGNSRLYQDNVTTKLQTEKDKADIEFAKTAKAGEQARVEIQQAKKLVKEENKLKAAQELKNKGANALDWITKNLGKPLKTIGIGYLGYESIKDAIANPAEFLRDTAVDVATGFNPLKVAADFIVRPTNVQEVGGVPPGEFSAEEKSLQETELKNNMQSLFERDTNIQTDETPKAEPLDIIKQDTNIGNKMSTFGRTADVSPGFVTPPSRQDLNVETERQQNFLGAT